MDTKYPTLRRPKRKLCYFTNKESPCKQWAGMLSFEDVDRMFDDLDSPSHADLLPPSPLLQTFDTETNQNESETSPVPQEEHLMEKLPEYQMGPEGDVLHPEVRSTSPELDVDLDIPFKAHGPIKTSSPIEQNIGIDVQKQGKGKDRVVSPILFLTEDEGKEAAKLELLPIQKPQCNGQDTEERKDSELEWPPSKVDFTKMSRHNKKAEASLQENTKPPVPAVRQEPECAAPEKNSENVHREIPVEMSTCVGKGVAVVLQKLKDAELSKHACSSKTPVKVPTPPPPPPPPEPEDDFLILEDDTPLWLSIPSKTATNKKQKQSKTSSADKGSSTDKGTKDIPREMPQEEQELEKAHSKLGSQTVDLEMKKKKKGKEKNNEVTGSGSKVAVTSMTSQKEKMEALCKESHTSKEKTPKKPQTPVLKGNRKMPCRQENTEPPAPAVRQEPKPAASEKNSDSPHRQPPVEMSTRVTAFLQKLKDAGQSKPACSSKSPAKVPTPPPEPEDDFLILEDDTPLWFSIPHKTATSKRQRQNKNSSSDKDSSADKGMKDSPLEMPQEEQELEEANSKLGSQTVDLEMKKKKGKEKNNEVTGSESEKEKLPGPQDLPAGDVKEQEKPNKKKKQTTQLPSKESNKAGDEPEDNASREIENKKPSRKTRKQEHKSSEKKSSEDDKEIMKSDMDGKAKRNKQPVVSEGISSEDNMVLGKRNRKQTGEWWLSCPQSTEETDNHQLTLKRSKKNSEEPSAAVASPVKAKKDQALKKRKQKQPALLSCQHTNKPKERITKQNRQKNTRGDMPDKRTATEAAEVFNTTESEQTKEQEQQEVPDQDLDQEQCSPLVFTHRDHSLNSGDQIFQRVYHHPSGKELSIAPAEPLSHRQPEKQLRDAKPAKRRRKPPGNWWTVNSVDGDLDSVSSPPQYLHPKEPKPCKENKKLPKQSTSPGHKNPKKGNKAVSSQPLGGAPVSPLKVKPLSAPKTVKRSLATFKDIFTSVTETPTVFSNRGTDWKNRRNAISRPAEYITCSKTDTDTLTQSSAHNHKNPQNSTCQSENTLTVFRSGPCSMIELEQYEESDDTILPSSRVHTVLSAADLCGPPLKPLILQLEDEANLTEWFNSLWSTTANGAAEITPDQFDWYCYQDRAIGFQVDINSGSFCNGKILLGSHMKKPLTVDHSATTVFNLLTSSVRLTINGRESLFSPGQSFMVKCGHAYSIQNINAQPAVLYFTRMLDKSSD